MLQIFPVTPHATSQRLVKAGLLGLACLLASACGVQEELADQEGAGAQAPGTSLIQQDAALYTWQNVSAGKPVTAQGTTFNNPQMLTDGIFAPEGTNWDTAQYAIIIPAGALQVDLGQSYTIKQLVVQADNNDSYAVDRSLDGTNWTRLAEVNPYGSWGLNTRPAINVTTGGNTRFLRIYATGGDGSYSVSELQAFAYVYTPDTNCCCTGTCGPGQLCPDVVCPQ